MKHKKSLRQMIGIGLFLLFLVGCGATPTLGEIEGTVTLNGNASKPIANVEVSLLGAEIEEVATTQTDSQGKYSFKDVEPGEYILGAAVQGQCMTLDLGDPVTVEADTVVKKDLSLSCTP